MRPTAKWKPLTGTLLLVATTMLATLQVEAQTAGQSPIETAVPRLEASALHRPAWTQAPAQPLTGPDDHDPQGPVSLHMAQGRRPFFSARGTAVGAAVGCAVGAVALYDHDFDPPSGRWGWSAAGCILLSLPGAFMGGLFIP